jgi:hypothetical protein
MTEIKLGLCNPPEPIYLYVGNGELSGESYLWYHYEIDKDKTIPVQQRGLTGYISELRLTTKEFKGKDNIKLDIVVNSDETYIIRTGIETNFAKTFLLSASLIQSFDKPLIVAANAGKENVVFCNLYDATTKARIHKEWDANADWAGIIKSIQSRLGTTLASATPSSSISEKAENADLGSPQVERFFKRAESSRVPVSEEKCQAIVPRVVATSGRETFQEEGQFDAQEPLKNTSAESVITQAQINRLWAVARTELKLNDEIIKNVILSFGYQSSKEITANKYDAVIQRLHDESVVAF